MIYLQIKQSIPVSNIRYMIYIHDIQIHSYFMHLIPLRVSYDRYTVRLRHRRWSHSRAPERPGGRVDGTAGTSGTPGAAIPSIWIGPMYVESAYIYIGNICKDTYSHIVQYITYNKEPSTSSHRICIYLVLSVPKDMPLRPQPFGRPE